MELNDTTRRNLNWVVLVIASVLTVTTFVQILGGDRSALDWVAMVCWPFVAVCTGYELATHKRLHL